MKKGGSGIIDYFAKRCAASNFGKKKTVPEEKVVNMGLSDYSSDCEPGDDIYRRTGLIYLVSRSDDSDYEYKVKQRAAAARREVQRVKQVNVKQATEKKARQEEKKAQEKKAREKKHVGTVATCFNAMDRTYWFLGADDHRPRLRRVG